MPRKPIPKKDLSVLTRYIKDELDYRECAKIVGTDTHSIFQWLGSRAIRALKSRQIPLSQESK